MRQAPRASSCCIAACSLAAVSCSCAAVLSNWLLDKVLLGAPQATPATESNQPESTNLNNVKAAGPSASPICLGIGSASASADHLCHQLCHQLCQRGTVSESMSVSARTMVSAHHRSHRSRPCRHRRSHRSRRLRSHSYPYRLHGYSHQGDVANRHVWTPICSMRGGGRTMSARACVAPESCVK